MTTVDAVPASLLTELAPLNLAYVHLTASTDERTLLGFRRLWPNTLMVSPVHSADPAAAGRAAAERWLGLEADVISFARAYLANPDWSNGSGRTCHCSKVTRPRTTPVATMATSPTRRTSTDSPDSR